MVYTSSVRVYPTYGLGIVVSHVMVPQPDKCFLCFLKQVMIIQPYAHLRKESLSSRKFILIIILKKTYISMWQKIEILTSKQLMCPFFLAKIKQNLNASSFVAFSKFVPIFAYSTCSGYIMTNKILKILRGQWLVNVAEY